MPAIASPTGSVRVGVVTIPADHFEVLLAVTLDCVLLGVDGDLDRSFFDLADHLVRQVQRVEIGHQLTEPEVPRPTCIGYRSVFPGERLDEG